MLQHRFSIAAIRMSRADASGDSAAAAALKLAFTQWCVPACLALWPLFPFVRAPSSVHMCKYSCPTVCAPEHPRAIAHTHTHTRTHTHERLRTYTGTYLLIHSYTLEHIVPKPNVLKTCLGPLIWLVQGRHCSKRSLHLGAPSGG